ncbi:hypothetical protein L3Y34_012561 [Caenorhabditis briggsae]|uniref:VWFA domain-containing protein n=1 Tax=Caenorhabditis briggsae TaxID=6238 RepID=A0AAE9CWR8_CAEBR|nr:hypothetical protein L3Y34_012561 [Caenorhabditis briggsae]
MITRVSLLRLRHARTILANSASISSKTSTLTIGNVSVQLQDAKNPDFVPAYYGLSGQPPQDLLPHLKWLIQKDKLKQDVFLLGVPGKIRLELVLRYLEATNREFEYLPITRDTTEADIKQRREIRDGTAYYTDLCAVRAALEGRVLVIDGVERAERNVLPILNNLLENREMQLDDGRFLMKHDKYDELKSKYDKTTLKKMGLERVSENFHIIALGLPVPRFTGNSLDPPFRSRFQCRNIEELSFNTFLEQAKLIAPNIKESELNDLISVVYAYNSEASTTKPRIATSVVENTLKIWNMNPGYSAGQIVDYTYPAKEVLSESEKYLIDTFKTKFKLSNKEKARSLKSKEGNTWVEINEKKNKKKVNLNLPTAPHPTTSTATWVPTNHQENLLADLALAFSKGDFILIGPKGSGKSTVLGELSKRINFNYVTMVLHQDMNTRELIQRRHMKENGDTVWEDSILVAAARNGDVCVLDGVEMVHPSVIMSLAQLVYHRRFDLLNGNRLIGEKEFKTIMERDRIDEAAMNQRGVFRIPYSFRLLFVGESQSKDHKWINENVLSLLPFYTVPELSLPEQAKIISEITHGSNTKAVDKLIKFVQKIKDSHDSGLKNTATSLSLRRLIHIAKRDLMQPGHLRELVEKAALSKFLPQITKETFEHELKAADLINDTTIRTKEDQKYLEMIRAATERAEDEALIPNVLFHHNKQHDEVLEDMARDMKLGSHLLLIGNQGVGKNKLTDRFLHLINRPRQYMQLHRDTTVQTLTMQTVVENGIIRHEDSALVKAARSGQILVIDEADKAPLHVIAILKSLLDTGNLVLGDGRSLRPASSFTEADKKNEKLVAIHPNFRIIMLANRPGFPFLGNNLFAVLGDLFAIHMIDHPGRQSEFEMIQKYGPTVATGTLNQLLTIFNELRDKTDQGILQYPYSTRELVNIVRHCNEFPNDPLPEVCRNVFDFDSYSEDTIAVIHEVFQKHGVPLGVTRKNDSVSLTDRISLGELKNLGKWSMKSVNFPKEYGFKPPALIDIDPPVKLSYVEKKLDKQNLRSGVFSESHCVWKIPMDTTNVIGDAIRVNDDLVVTSVNPPKLFHCKNFMDSDVVEEINLQSFLPPVSNMYQPVIRLAYLGGDNVLIHEEEANFTAVVSLPDQMGTVIQRNSSFTKTIGAMLTGSNYPWRLSNQKCNHALVYEWGGNQMLVYTDEKHGVTVQHGSLPFKIKRVYANAPQNWTVVSEDNENYILKLDNEKCLLEKIDSNVETGFDSIATKLRGNEMTIVADPYYFINTRTDGDVFGIPRKPTENYLTKPGYYRNMEKCANVDVSREAIFLGDTLVRALPTFRTPKEYIDEKIDPYQTSGFLESIDLAASKISYVPVPQSANPVMYESWGAKMSKAHFQLIPWDDEKVMTVDMTGFIRSFELSWSTLGKSFDDWKRMTGGSDDHNLRMEFDRQPDDVDMEKLEEPKLGKFDPDNAPHHGGNQWMGGTGGYNTAGLGGIGGPFRLDAGHDVHQMPDFAKEQVPKHILKKAREIAKQEYAKKLREINMSEHDADGYEKVWKRVQVPSKKLAAVIDQLEAKKKEREWTKHQTSGDLDDGKLIEGVTGEQNIYRRRVDKVPDPGAPQTKPKRLRLCLDVSGSMYRFNGYDQRLTKTMEAALMTMTALDGKTDKVQYDIVGHSGDSPSVSFVKTDQHPKNNKDRLDVLKRMIAHTQYCASGDNTVAGLEWAGCELNVKKDDFDETVVILVSDANLRRYNIQPRKVKDVMTRRPGINSFVILIGSLSNEADEIQSQLPAGKAFVLKDTSELPKIMETIFSSTIAQ